MTLSSLSVIVGTVWLDDSDGVISTSREIERAWVWAQPGAVVERRDGRDVVFAQLEVEHVEVTRNPLGVHRLGDHDVTDLQMPTNNHLRRCLAVGIGDAGDCRMIQEPAPTQRAPRLGR